MKDHYIKQITMYCPVCGGTIFSCNETNGNINYTCAQCKKVLTREDLESANQENLSANLEELGHEAFIDLQKDLQSIFKRK